MAVAIPFVPHANVLGFVPLPVELVLMLLGITALYVVATELLKRSFYRRSAWLPSSAGLGTSSPGPLTLR